MCRRLGVLNAIANLCDDLQNLKEVVASLLQQFSNKSRIALNDALALAGF